MTEKGVKKGKGKAASKPPRKLKRKGLVGCKVPRIYTPPLGPLTRETTRGYELIEFAEVVLGLTLLPWQKWLAKHALEILPDGTYRFRTVLLLIARQNGKSTFMLILALWRMYGDAAPLVIGTAQSLDIAEDLWTSAVELAQDIPELADLIEHVDKTNGKKALRLTTGEKYKVAAASRRGGRGLTGDLVLLDELREHQNWNAWGAVSKTTMARKFAQVWGASNAGDLTSIVLRHLRTIAHAPLGNPDNLPALLLPAELAEDDDELDDESLGIFEWSARPDRAIGDREGWAEANPSLGYTITERAIASARRTDPEGVFRTEVLCQFVDTMGAGPFEEGTWESARVPKVVRDGAKAAGYCIDVSHDRKMAHVAVAFWDTEGRIRVEIAASRPGTDWVIPWLTSPKRKIAPQFVTFQAVGAPVSSLAADLEAEEDIGIISWQGSDVPKASGIAFDGIRDGLVTHGDQPALDLAAITAATKTAGDGWMIDRKASTEDAAPLVAFVGAVWLLKANKLFAESVYEERGLLVF